VLSPLPRRLRGPLHSATALLGSALVLAAASGCRPDRTPPAGTSPVAGSSVPVRLMITDRAADELLQVAQGGTVTLELPLRSGTGYRWVLETTPAPVLEGDLEGRFVPRSDPRPGGPILQRWEFAAYAPGQVRLVLSLRRPWEPAAEGDRRFSVDVEVVSSSNS